MNTPGVYIQETLSQPAVVAGASTAIPVFIGYTELPATAPVRITSMLDYHTHLGGAHESQFDITLDANDEVTGIIPDYRFYLYDSVRLYFQNGGGPCYVLSIGTYTTHTAGILQFLAQLPQLETLEEATLVLIPDLHAEFKDFANQKQQVFNSLAYPQVTSKILDTIAPLQNKFAIFDLHEVTGDANADVAAFRAAVNPTLTSDLKYGAAYYPWLQLQDVPSVGYAQLTLNKSFAGNPLVDTVAQLSQDAQTMANHQYGFVPTQANCRAHYASLKATFLAATSNKKSKFSAIFKYLYMLVANLDPLAGLAPTVVNEVASLKSDDAVSLNIRALYRFKGILDAHTTPDLLTNSGFTTPFDVAWFNTGTGTDTAVQVETDASALTAYATQVNGPNNAYQAWADAAQILADLESDLYVNLDQLFAMSDRVWKALQYKLKIAEQQLMTGHPVYARIKAATETYLRKIPSQGAIAGAYATNDRNLGVWRAPANISLQGVQGPLTGLSNADQDGMNEDPNSGKAVNAVRTFTGRGTLIWGARTLASNSAEWRYVPVRRFFSYAEAAIKKAAEAFVFAPNHAQTWVQVNAMITSFLVEQWKNGALVGNTYEDAFQVSVGQGNSPGEMDVSVGLAVARPAEFITVRFSQSMQNA